MSVNIFENILNQSNQMTVDDFNNDGSPDILLTGAEHAGKNGIFWGCSNETNCDPNNKNLLNFTENRFTELPRVNDWGLILEHNVTDIDNDGELEIILNRTSANSVEGGENFHLGWYIQMISIENKTRLVNVTENYFDNYNSEIINGVCQGKNHYIFNLGLYDYDEDGKIELFNLPDQGILQHEWEWNGSKFIKIK